MAPHVGLPVCVFNGGRDGVASGTRSCANGTEDLQGDAAEAADDLRSHARHARRPAQTITVEADRTTLLAAAKELDDKADRLEGRRTFYRATAVPPNRYASHGSSKEGREAAARKSTTGRRKMVSKQELIDTGASALFVRHNARGTNVVDAGRSITRDKRISEIGRASCRERV